MAETESMATGVERRRSQRIPFSLAVYVMGMPPSFSFIERSEIVEISSHGCQLLAPRPLPRSTQVRLDRRTRVAITAAHVMRSTPVESMAVRMWRIGLELKAPGNVWGIAQPPRDWVTPP
jgi:PilZ domain-containing protein